MSNLTRTSAAGAVSPAEVSELLIAPFLEQSTFSTVATYMPVNGSELRIPKVTDGTNAGWVSEGSEINIDDLSIDEVPIVFRKLAALVPVTNELIEDSIANGGGVLQIVGDSLTRQLARKLDSAAFGNTVTNGPKGIQSVSAAIDLGPTGLDNSDVVLDGIAALESAGNRATHVVVHTDTATRLAKLKVSVESTVPMLGTDATQRPVAQIAGLPIVSSPFAKPDTIYIVDASRIILAVRHDAEIVTDSSVYFSSDRTAIRATLRVGIGWADPAAITVATFDQTLQVVSNAGA